MVEEGFLTSYMNKMSNQIFKGVDEIINQFAEEHGLSRKCAEYYIGKTFNLCWELDETNFRIDCYLEPKSVEEILNSTQLEDDAWELECLKEITKKK